MYGIHLLLSMLVSPPGDSLSVAIGETRSTSVAAVAESRAGGESTAQDAMQAPARARRRGDSLALSTRSSTTGLRAFRET